MSGFFGFDTSLPRDGGHKPAAPGFAQPHDAFAGLSGRGVAADDEVLDFEDTYDGLAAQLDESGDAFNDDTFGDAPSTQQSVGRDFDFSGQTDNVSRAIEEERMRFSAAVRPAPTTYAEPKQPSKPLRTGYESYIPQLEADASLWGIAPPPKRTPEPATHQRQVSQQAGRKAMTLEEVEASLRAESKQPPRQQQEPAPQQLPSFSFPQAPPPQQYQQQPPQYQQQPPQAGSHPPPLSYAHPPQILQRPHPPAQQQQPVPTPKQAELPGQGVQQPQILQRQQPRGEAAPQRAPQVQQVQQAAPRASPQPRQILQNPNRLSGHGQPMSPPQQQQQQQVHRQQDFPRLPPTGPGGHNRGPSYNGPVITNPAQILQLTEEDRAAFLQEEARRAKRNHKIHLLSKDNGLMTPQDKNFITRIQLQQLVTATGNVDAQGPEAALNEDFYYQVYAQIRGANRRDPHQPASQFAHTYLFQTGGRYGMRRNMRHGDNHMARMEQQVQRAVEAAKAKPKNKQLVIEGSLGKISFSNAKTPKPLLNIKRTDEGLRPTSAQRRPSRSHDSAATDRRTTLRNIENVYSTLMRMEDHERQVPPPLSDDSDAGTIQRHMEWREKLQKLNSKLWVDLRVMEPIIPK
jgi:DNA topoisomerase 2-associated protein PAT1